MEYCDMTQLPTPLPNPSRKTFLGLLFQRQPYLLRIIFRTITRFIKYFNTWWVPGSTNEWSGDHLKEIGNRTGGLFFFPIGSFYYLFWLYNTTGVFESKKILMKMWWVFNHSKSLLGIVLLLKKKNEVTQATRHSIKQISLLFLLVICFWLSLLHIRFLFVLNNKNGEINYHFLQMNFKTFMRVQPLRDPLISGNLALYDQAWKIIPLKMEGRMVITHVLPLTQYVRSDSSALDFNKAKDFAYLISR